MAASDPYTSAEDKKRLRSLARGVPITPAEWAQQPDHPRRPNLQAPYPKLDTALDRRPGFAPDGRRTAPAPAGPLPEDMMSGRDWTRAAIANDARTLRERGLVGAAQVAGRGAYDMLGRAQHSAFDVMLGNPGRSLARAAAPILFGTGGAAAAGVPAAGERPDFSNVQSGAGAPVRARMPGVEGRAGNMRAPLDRSNGLTRIVQTAPGVFTDAAGAQGEERYYNDLGFRADTSYGDGVPTVGGGGPSGPAEWARREQASRIDPMTDAGHAAILASGRRGQGLLRDRLADSARRAQLDEVNQRTPEERAELAREGARQAGELTRTQTEAAGRIGAANITAQQQAQSDLADREAEQLKQFEESERYWAERLNDPETRGAAIAETLDPLVNMPPEAVTQMLSDPNDPRGARTRAALRMQLRATTGDANLNPAQMQRATGLQRFLDGSLFGQAGAFATDDDWFTDTLSGDDIMPGLSDDDFERMLIDPDALVQRRNRGY